MGILIGIDIGGSTTKIVGFQDGALVSPILVKATDPVASLFGAFGKFVDYNNLPLNEIEHIMLTGVGSSYIEKPIYGINTCKVEEFLANGYGGLELSGLNSAVIVSMGTGTAIVKADQDGIQHLGGTGIGGGTIHGLASKILNIRDMDVITNLAISGNLSNVDLTVGDISKEVLPGLPPDTTASNFGKISDVASLNDMALGILNMTFESIAVVAVFAIKNSGLKNIVLIGNLTTIPQCDMVFKRLKKQLQVNFIIPQYSEYATALGAALAKNKGIYKPL